MADKKEKINVHEGHRKRLRQFLTSKGPRALPPHVLLELILGYSIKRQNTNELAHRLINEFGSVHNVFKAPYEKLLTIKGIGEQTAIFIVTVGAMITSVGNYPVTSKYIPNILDTDKIGKFLIEYYKEKNEVIAVMIPADASGKPYDILEMGVGHALAESITRADIATTLAKYNSSRFILAHNHLGKTCIPSDSDMLFTRKVFDFCENLLVSFDEHFVVSKTKYFTILKKKNIFDYYDLEYFLY